MADKLKDAAAFAASAALVPPEFNFLDEYTQQDIDRQVHELTDPAVDLAGKTSMSIIGAIGAIGKAVGSGLLGVGSKVVKSPAAEKAATGAITGAGALTLFSIGSRKAPTVSGLVDAAGLGVSPIAYGSGVITRELPGIGTSISNLVKGGVNLAEQHPVAAGAAAAGAVGLLGAAAGAKAASSGSADSSLKAYMDLMAAQNQAQSTAFDRQFAALTMQFQQQQAMLGQEMQALLNSKEPSSAVSTPASVVQRVTISGPKATAPAKKKKPAKKKTVKKKKPKKKKK